MRYDTWNQGVVLIGCAQERQQYQQQQRQRAIRNQFSNRRLQHQLEQQQLQPVLQQQQDLAGLGRPDGPKEPDELPAQDTCCLRGLKSMETVVMCEAACCPGLVERRGEAPHLGLMVWCDSVAQVSHPSPFPGRGEGIVAVHKYLHVKRISEPLNFRCGGIGRLVEQL